MLKSLIRGLLDRLVLVLGVLAGGCIPSFMAQYRQRIGGALDQAQKDLEPFQQIADRHHGGKLTQLIQHHLDSIDISFRSEGVAIQGMVDSVHELQAAVSALQTDIWHQIAYLARHTDLPVLRATWRHFEPAFALSFEGLQVAAAFAVLVWLIFLTVWSVIAWFFRPEPFDSPWPE